MQNEKNVPPSNENDIPTIQLKKGSSKPIYSGHPWVFASAIKKTPKPEPASGAEVRIADAKGQILGRGFYSPGSAIPVRLYTFDDQPVDAQLLQNRLDHAIELRQSLLGLGPVKADDAPEGLGGNAGRSVGFTNQPTTAYRLVHAEGDGLPGLIVDRYGDYLCVQIGTAGVAKRLDIILDHLQERLNPKGIIDRSDPKMLRLEKLEITSGTVLRGEAPEGPVEVLEDGLRFSAHLKKGQKTGLYLDQRDNRALFGRFASGRDVLDVFSYNGAFSMHAARAGAKSLTLVDSSEPALEVAAENFKQNNIEDADLVSAPWIEAFRHLRQKEKSFDLLVLDPPKFARARNRIKEALSGYRELNAQAARLIRPGGILFTCSCSGVVSNQDFERTVASGLRQAGRHASLLEVRGPGLDHPIPPGFEQGSYLKCLVLRLD